MELETREFKRPRLQLDRLPDLASRVFGNSLLFTRIAASLSEWRDKQNVDLINQQLNSMASNHLWPSESEFAITPWQIHKNNMMERSCFDEESLEVAVCVQSRRLRNFSQLPAVTAAVLRKCPNVKQLNVYTCETGLPESFETRFNDIIRLTITEVVRAIEQDRLAIKVLEIGGVPFLSAAKPLLQAVSQSIMDLSFGTNSKPRLVKVDDVGLDALKRSPALKSVNIGWQISETDFLRVFEIESLQRLFLMWLPEGMTGKRLAKIFRESRILQRLEALFIFPEQLEQFLINSPVSRSIEYFILVAQIDEATPLLRLAAEKLPNARRFAFHVHLNTASETDVARLLVDLADAALFELFQSTEQRPTRLAVSTCDDEIKIEKVIELLTAVVQTRNDIAMRVTTMTMEDKLEHRVLLMDARNVTEIPLALDKQSVNTVYLQFTGIVEGD